MRTRESDRRVVPFRKVRRQRRLPRFEWLRRRWRISAGLLVFAVLLGAIPANSALKTREGCWVTSVVDGDTVRMFCPDLGYVRGRVLGYDTPEVDGRCGWERWMAFRASLALRWQLLTAAELQALPQGTDRYGRTLVSLRADGRSVAEAMVNAGLARRYNGGRRDTWCL